jgi:asparagine synthase (glutamine-hydrolysing)
MSGLAGIVSRNPSFDENRVGALVDAMAQAQKHREPDGWRVVARGALVFATETSDAESEASASGLALAFDGKITNAGAVRESLGKAGLAPRGHSDRELVLRAWEAWGTKCLEQLQGRFAFVLHDAQRATTYLARDRFGHKPIYYTLRDERVYFASEVKTLLAVLPQPTAPNELGLVEWTLYGDVLPPRTLFRGVETLPIGHWREIGAGGAARDTQAYYDITKTVDRERHAEYASKSPQELIDLLDVTLERVIGKQIEGQRGEVGVLLSGGVDSAVIAAQARKHVRLKGYNFSAWRDSVMDESRMAKKVAAKLDVPLHSIYLDGDTYRRELARVIWLFETPLWHIQGVPTHLLARRAFADGVRILLAGVCLGPLSGAVSPGRYRWVLPPPAVSLIPGPAMRLARKLVYSANGFPVGNPHFVQNLGVGLKLIDGGKRTRMIQRFNESYGFLDDFNQRRIQVMRLTDNAFFWQRFFRQGDNLCMAESVEFCDAAVDSDYVSLILNYPADIIRRKNVQKWVLKELALKYVPREVSYQPKHAVYVVPIEQFFIPMFRESLFRGGFLESYLGLDWDAVNALYQQQDDKTQVLYRLVNVEVWGRMFFLGQSVDEVTAMLQ